MILRLLRHVLSDRKLDWNEADREAAAQMAQAFKREDAMLAQQKLPPERQPWQSEAQGHFKPMMRDLVMLRPRQPFVDWMHQRLKQDEATLEEVRADLSMAFLVPAFTTQKLVETFVKDHWERYFAQMLERAEQNPRHWPGQRTWAMFKSWFDMDCVSCVLDLSAQMGIDKLQERPP